jgi:sialate O-acetylesterase
MTLFIKTSFKTLLRLSFLIILISELTIPALTQSSSFRLAPIFTDNMVLQQQSNVPIWGKGIPGTDLVLRTSWGEEWNAKINSDGKWSIKLPTPKAGGPFQISFRHQESVTILRNVLIGEVWLCSGQSNMEMPLEGWPPSDTISNSSVEIEQALYPSIRIFSVRRACEASPSDVCVGNWQECSPIDVRSFSATAFFFGKMLYSTLKVPIGLINSSYGGTPIEAWMSKEALNTFSEFAESLKKLDENKDSLQLLNQWITQHPNINILERNPQHKWTGLNFQDESCADKNYNDNTWNEIKLPNLWERSSLGEFDGAVWLRKQITIPSAWIGKDLTILLGPIDDMDETFINGKNIGNHLGDGFWKVDRVYKIPGAIVQDSLLQIAVRVIDTQGGGGIWGDERDFYIYQDINSTRISLAGNWKYLPVAEYRANTFYVFGAAGNEFNNRPKLTIEFGSGTPTSLFNGMINPLVPFTIKGVIWYQGENNASNGSLYKKLFPAMINDWRRVFSCGDFSFYFVQLAPFDYGTQTQSQLLREAQLRTLSVKNTGMAVILDIGNPKNIHPTNKQDVGKRLALWALAKTYGKKVVYSGPIYQSMKNEKNKIVLSFQLAENGLMLKNLEKGNKFQIAGIDKQFKDADVKIQGNKLIVSHPEILAPQAVRYAFSNTAEATLFNKEGLPASSFRTDNWEE